MNTWHRAAAAARFGPGTRYDKRKLSGDLRNILEMITVFEKIMTQPEAAALENVSQPACVLSLIPL